MKLLPYFVILVSFSVQAEVVTDGSLGAVQSFSGQFEIGQRLGTTVGNNLFHSFQEFNLQKGESATFTGDAALKNVISRVTGGSLSSIDGLLKSSIGNANFYFINPAGITFGANAQVDVPAAFHVSTADSLRFADGQQFVTASTAPSVLSVSTPSSFGFLGTQIASIQLQGSQLTFNGSQVSLSEGDILMDGGSITNPTGEVQIYAVGTTPVDISFATPSDKLLNGKVNLTTNSSVSVSGNGAGRLLVRAGDIQLTDSAFYASNKGDSNAAVTTGIDIVNSTLSLDNSVIYTNSLALGNAPNIAIKSNQLAISNGGQISSNVYSLGNAGTIDIATNTLSINGLGQLTGIFNKINADSTLSGNAGTININADTLSIFNRGQITSDTWSSGTAGSINVIAKELLINGEGGYLTGIFSDANPYSTGHAGNVAVKSDNLSVINDGQISSTAYSQGNAGNITVENNAITLFNGGKLTSKTSAEGKAGTISVNTKKLMIDGNNSNETFTGIFTETVSDLNNAGDSGTVFVKADTLDMINGGRLSSSSYSPGNAGNLIVDSRNITINNSSGRFTGIFSETNKTGNAGNVWVKSENLFITNAGKVSSSNYAEGNAGNVFVDAANLTIDGKGTDTGFTGILSETVSDLNQAGNAGSVSVKSDYLTLVSGAQISSSSYFQGKNAGDVSINAGTMLIDRQGARHATGVFSDTFSNQGNAGSVTVEAAQNLTLLNLGSITSSTYSPIGSAGTVRVNAPTMAINNGTISAMAIAGSSGKTGNINVTSTQVIDLYNKSKITLQNNATVADPKAIFPTTVTVTAPLINLKNSQITTASTGNVNASHIAINFTDKLLLDPSYITTTANLGNGGTIDINGGKVIYLQDSGFKTSVSGANSNGGNINVKADVLVMNTGVIQANAVGGSGGDINLKLQALIPSYNSLIKGGTKVIWQPFIAGFNVIQAASENGVSGTLTITAPQFDISGSTSGLDSAGLALPRIERDACSGTIEQTSSLAPASKGGLPIHEAETAFIPPLQKTLTHTAPVSPLMLKGSTSDCTN